MDFTLSKEQEMMKKLIRQFAERELAPIAAQIDEEDKIPNDLIPKLAKQKLFGITGDRKYGGSGGNFLDLVLTLEQLGRVSVSVAFIVDVHYLAVEAILKFGNDEQKAKYLPPLLQGNAIGSFAFTEAATGSDPKAITTVASFDGAGYVLNGSKRFISNAPLDGLIILFARYGEGISAFITEKNKEGYSTPKPWAKMGVRGLAVADIDLKDVKVPAIGLLGGKGGGFNVMVNIIAMGKLGISALLLGCAQAALEEAIKYAKGRESRGKPISNFLTIQCLIADIAAQLEAARWLTYRCASLLDRGEDIVADSALTKLFVSEMATEVTRKALQVHGGYGYIKEFKIERLYRDAKVGEIIEGVNEIQRVIVAGNLLK